MDFIKNEIFLERQNKVIVEPGTKETSHEIMVTAIKNIENMGYIFSPKLIKTLCTLGDDSFIEFYKNTMKCIKNLKGDDVEHRPMYPNFPKEVMEKSESELYFNALIHYFNSFLEDVAELSLDNKGLPEIEKEERFPLFEDKNLTMVELAGEDEFKEMIKNLISSRTSTSQADKSHIRTVFNSLDESETVEDYLPEEIPHKENLIFVLNVLMENIKNNEENKEGRLYGLIHPYIKTPTDVLRLAAAMSEQDVSLGSPVKFRKFRRFERRILLGLLENKRNLKEDMYTYKSLWITLAEILHPGEYKMRYPLAFAAFKTLRENKKIKTFNSKVQKAIDEKDVMTAIRLLKSKPGEFARRLDHLLRLGIHSEQVVSEFNHVAHEVATPVLLQVMTHFKHRPIQEGEPRTHVYFPKGEVSKAYSKEIETQPIDKEYATAVANACHTALLSRFTELGDLGNVLLDERLKDYTVPFSQRSSSRSLKTISRGSRLGFSDKKTIRMFMHWADTPGERIDVDASVVFMGDDWEYLTHISYTNLKDDAFGAYHSGDITSAPKGGASEFIDIDVEQAISNGARYVIMQVLAYTQQPFSNIPKCFVGWMGREHVNSGEIYEPSTVEQRIDLTAPNTIAIPVVFDLVKKEFVWMDLGFKHYPSFYSNNIENHLSSSTAIVKGVMERDFPNLYDLFKLHVEARGKLVTKKEVEKENKVRLEKYIEQVKKGEREKDDVPEEMKIHHEFSLEGDVTPYDYEKIISEFLV